MEVIFGIHGVWDVIDPGSNDAKQNNIAKALLFQSIPEEQILQIVNFKFAKEMWDAIKSRNMGAKRVKDARLHKLIREFDGMMMKETETIDEYASRITAISSKAATLGQSYEERKLVQKVFTSLPSRFIQVVASLEQVLDLKTVGFEDVVGRLKTYEERIKGHVLHSEEGELLFNNSESPSSSNQFSRESSRGRGKGSNQERGNGRGGGRGSQNRGSQERSNEGDKRKGKKDYSEVQCFRCDEFGHFFSRCPERMKKRQTHLAEAKEKEPSLYMVQCVQEKVYLNEQKDIPKDYESGSNEQDLWYLDNGASNHMTGNLSFFSELNKRVGGKVKFGDGSYVDICGKWSILLVGKTGKQQLLTDIYYIPSLQSNIISLGQATESGCDIRMKDDYLLILGHLNFESMKQMVKTNMVIGMPKVDQENQICDSCLVGKQTRKPFPKSANFRATRALELIHGDLCGPITLSTLVGNRKNVKLSTPSSDLKSWWKRKIVRKSRRFEPIEGGEFTSRDFNRFSENEEDFDATRYRKIVGSLRYLLQTRPDLAYSVGVVSRYMQNPKQSHATLIKQILRYIQGTLSFGISYTRGKNVLVGYSDSSHNIDQDDGRSTTGHVFYLESSPITWCSQKQCTVALSSYEAEYMLASAAAVWLRDLISELFDEEIQAVVLRIDNTSAIALVKNPVFHGRTKHIKSRFHYIRECVDREEVSV
ncbi:uncharacterized protein LOC143529223 [Bidens hawaiensis]|uniref:uncharacterized protein LOC143529223 n=1 Tax=Bidens hawaiensis TaxID=980011 RepID=UPI00404B8392